MSSEGHLGAKHPTKHGCGPRTVAGYREHAESVLPRDAWDYYSSGANDMITLAHNRACFSSLHIRPRVSATASRPDTRTKALGEQIASPVCAAATAMQCMAHPDGEAGTVRAAQATGVVHVLSSLATMSLEQVARAAPQATKWFQLYVYTDRKLTESVVRRAEAAGYSAIVLTVDTPVLGRREPDMRNRFQLPKHLQLGILKDVASTAHQHGVKTSKAGSALAEFVREQFDASLDWADVAWLKRLTSLPLLVKGVMTAEDARLAEEAGVDGIIVSNHGARQLDCINSTLAVLPEIVAAVSKKVEVFLDGGVRSGRDAFKAIALGARAVFVGRPMLWGLAHTGEVGATRVLQLLHEEFAAAMAHAGCATVGEIGPHLLAAPGTNIRRTSVAPRSKL